MFACEMQLFRSARVPFVRFRPRVQTRREARRGWAALTITDDRRGRMPARRMSGGDVKVCDDNYK